MASEKDLQSYKRVKFKHRLFDKIQSNRVTVSKYIFYNSSLFVFCKNNVIRISKMKFDKKNISLKNC